MLKTAATGKKISDIAFWLGMLCELAVSPSGFVFGGYNEKLIILLGMVCFSVSVFFSVDIKKDRKAIAAVCGFGLLCFFFQRRALVLRIGLFLLAAVGREVRKMVKLFFYGSWVIILLGVAAAFLGDRNPMYLEDVFRHEVERRYTFGFFHPNGFSFFWVKQYIMFLYLYRDKLPVYVLFIAESAGLIPLVFSRSKIAVCVCLLLLVTDMLLHIRNIKEKAADILFYAGNVLLACELLLVYTLGILPYPQVHVGDARNLWDYMNEVTSGRLWHARDVFLEYVPGVFGIADVEEGTEIGFVNSLYSEGILFMVIFIAVLFYLMYKMRKAKDVCGMLLLLAFACYALAESFLPYMNKNMIWIIAAAYIPLKEKDRSR